MKRVLFVINPKSGVDRDKKIKLFIENNLDLNRFSYEISLTRYAHHGIEIAKNAASSGVDFVVAVGGDGSVNEIVQGILGSKTTLAILPKGSGNGLSRSLGIPMNIEQAIQLLNHGKTVEIDVGEINGHLFVSNAGVGFDAVVIEKFAKSKRRGFKAYSQIITKNLWRYKPMEYTIVIDGKKRTEEAFMLTVANGIQLGYGFKIAPLAQIQDGLLDVIILKKFQKVRAFDIAIKAFLGKIMNSRFLIHEKGKHILIRHPQLKGFQFDGEFHHCTGFVEIKIKSEKLKVQVPGNHPLR